MATMDPAPQRGHRGGPRTNGHVDGGGSGRRPHHGNKRWVADGVAGRGGTTTPHVGGDGERWEKGGYKGNEIFWQELVKAREAEREKAIAEGKMDDPLKPKRLEDAITMVGVCLDMCPRFERYRRERENNLFEWETIPGTKKVDHKRAVKAYERAAGDKTLPSDLRPPDVLKRTLDYLFHELLPHGGFSETFNFIRDRSRAVRNDFTMQHEMGSVAIECHGRCARFHILALHIERDHPGFSIAMEEQQLMNTLQSLKEFYQDQRGHYQSPTELEMRVYHRLVHIRDQRERHDDIPQALLNHPVFELTTKFRARVQAKSAPITKASLLVVDAEAMQIFAELADVLRREGNVVMTYLVACLLERHFGKDTIENIESIRGDLSLSDIIDGYSGMGAQEQDTDIDVSVIDETETQVEPPHSPHESPKPLQRSGTQWLNDTFGPKPTQSAFFNSGDPPARPSVPPPQSAFSNLKTTPNAFGTASFGTSSALTNAVSTAPPISIFEMNKNDMISSSFPLKATEVSSFPESSVSSFPPFNPAPVVDQTTTSKPQVEQSSQIAALSPSKPPQANELTLPVVKKSIFGSETSTSTLNPLASTFIPAPDFVGASVFNAPTAPSFGATPLSSVQPPPKNRKPSAFVSTSSELSTPFPQQPTQERSISDVNTSKIPIVSSPPSMDSVPLESTMGQTPPPQPPPLNRRQPISLPSTPTASVFIRPTHSEIRKSMFGSLRNIQTTPLSALPTEILSPLVLHSPTSKSLSSIPSLHRRDSIQSPLKAVVSATDVKAETEPSAEKLDTSLVSGPPPAEKPSLNIMKATALHFARRGWLVKDAFSKWRQRLSNQAKWIEACRRSTIYKEKARAERLSHSTGSHPSTNSHVHRKAPSEAQTPLKKRLRDRLSGEYRPPTNDEELARRFEKNHEDHTRRWARGSFLGVLRDFLQSARSPLPDNWCAWLSLNQESDGTAIWLEQKFDVPDSGKWKNENVFQIPMSGDHVESARSCPGVVIFERTPLTSVTDILGRKYRVLEDCTRLREIIEAFPADRHYVPSLLCIAWSERDPDSSKDLDDMVESMVEGGMLTSTHDLLISTGALDMETKLDKVLHDIPFDLDGRLVKRVSFNDLFGVWEHQWEETTRRWLSYCTVYGEFNWDAYAKLLEGCTRLLAQLVDSATSLLRDDDVASDIPHLQLAKGMDSNTTFCAVLDWLQTLPKTDFIASLTGDIRAHQNLGRDFPTMTFLTQLYALARAVAAHVADVHAQEIFFVSRSRLDDTSKEIETLKVLFEEEMKACHVVKIKPLKRLASFAEPSLDLSRTSTPRPKKQRVSPSDSLATDGETTSLSPPSPPLSTSTSTPSESVHTIVTPAMLRALTKDIRAKYGASSTLPGALSASTSG